MKQEYFLSQRLGFTNQQADRIRQLGVERFLQNSFQTVADTPMPSFLENAPKSRKEYRQLRETNEEKKKLLVVMEAMRNVGVSYWWMNKMQTDEYPLREKMVLFWHNHFVSSFQKVKSTWSMYRQNQLFRDYAFGNFKELTKRILYDNAMISYLDNQQNRVKTPNENLSRELLELFTLGVGNYTEGDIKEGARALAGLNLSDEGGRYYKIWEDNFPKTYLGKTGNWKADDIIDIIFQQPKAAHRLTEKLLKYFVSDTPSVLMVNEYAEYLKKQNFEIKPFLEKMVRDERFLKSAGEKIKDPLTFILQTHHEFQLPLPQAKRLVPYFNGQGMVLLNPPNVKGWDGGKTWLSSQKLIQRISIVGTLSNGKSLEAFAFKRPKKEDMAMDEMQVSEENIFGKNTMETDKMPEINWDKSLKNNKDIIKSLTDRLVFNVSKDMQTDMEQILKYDFKPSETNATQAVTRLAEYVMKSPEFQVY